MTAVLANYKTVALAMLIVTVISAIMLVYNNFTLQEYLNNTRRRPAVGGIVYSAFHYEGEPNGWCLPEELNITEIKAYGENTVWLHIVVPHDRDPHDYQSVNPVFQFKDRFYQISDLWVTPAIFAPTKTYYYDGVSWQEDTSSAFIHNVILLRDSMVVANGAGWILTALVIYKGRKRQQQRR